MKKRLYFDRADDRGCDYRYSGDDRHPELHQVPVPRSIGSQEQLEGALPGSEVYFAEYDEYSALNTIGFDPEPGNRYTYCNTLVIAVRVSRARSRTPASRVPCATA